MTDRSLRLPILMTIGALVVFATYVRVWGLWDFFLTPDEALVLQISSQPKLVDVLIAASYHPHPPLRYFVLHSMVFFSDNPLFLRSLSLLPGVALIPLFFLLGRRTAGTASGIAMATIVAFSPAAMLLSEVLRTYMLATFFVAAGLYAFFSYLEEHRSKFLYLYGASMSLGLLSHYFTMLPVAAVGIVWVFCAARSQRPLRELIRAVLVNVPFAVLAVAAYALHLSSRNGPHWWNSIEKGHLVSQFPDTAPDFLVNGYRLFTFFFLSSAWWLAVLALLGMTALWITKRRVVVMVIVVTITINIDVDSCEEIPVRWSTTVIFSTAADVDPDRRGGSVWMGPGAIMVHGHGGFRLPQVGFCPQSDDFVRGPGLFRWVPGPGLVRNRTVGFFTTRSREGFGRVARHARRCHERGGIPPRAHRRRRHHPRG